MKKFLSALFIVMLMGATDVFAQVLPDGYYRIYNKETGRHASLVDNKGSMTVSGSSYKYDFGAISLKNTFDDVVDDPGAIIKFIYHNGGKSSLMGYYLQAQGVSTSSIINRVLKIDEEEGEGTDLYVPYAKEGIAMGYVIDNAGYFSVLVNSASTLYPNRFWYIKPVTNEGDAYFGVKPTLKIGSKYYTTLYAEFAFKLPSSVKAYYVSGADDEGNVQMTEIKDKVPGATPVLLECSSPNAADNKLLPLTETLAAVSGNLLKGVYFNFNKTIKSYKHQNRTAYNATTMRVLKEVDGKVGFGKSTDTYLPANQAYLDISTISNKSENVSISTAIINVEAAPARLNDKIYDLQGREVKNPARGIYIQNGKKVVLK
ncbi:MAG: hypothetical protein IJ604_14100 [Prevotella sp.]|nr:hypothetical protein [Prevotella sp.]